MAREAGQKLDNYIYLFSKAFNYIGVTILLIMMFTVATDVFLRYVFNSPIEGVYEGVELMMAVVFCYGIAYTQRQKGHVSVNLLVSRLGPGPREALSAVVSLVSFTVFALMTWQSFLKAGVALATRETTYGGVGPFGHVPIFPFVYLTSAACLVFCLELLADFARSVRRLFQK
ncbi:MAG: TRAP transporter small permease [Deltaproteobacteria bacterium]|nr:TRAP transporter small permease [Deltaproteobacteria bacterium]